MSRTIYVAFLEGFNPSWGENLPARLTEWVPGPIEPLSSLALGMDPYYAPERGQYNATLVLARLLRYLPEPQAKIVGLTNVDLFIPVLTFVFGQAQLEGPGALVSTYRLRNEFYGLPPDAGLLRDRTIKEVVHELGHTFGLVHCRDYECVMHASTYVEEIDLKGPGFCSACRGGLHAATGTNATLGAGG